MKPIKTRRAPDIRWVLILEENAIAGTFAGPIAGSEHLAVVVFAQVARSGQWTVDIGTVELPTDDTGSAVESLAPVRLCSDSGRETSAFEALAVVVRWTKALLEFEPYPDEGAPFVVASRLR